MSEGNRNGETSKGEFGGTIPEFPILPAPFRGYSNKCGIYLYGYHTAEWNREKGELDHYIQFCASHRSKSLVESGSVSSFAGSFDADGLPIYFQDVVSDADGRFFEVLPSEYGTGCRLVRTIQGEGKDINQAQTADRWLSNHKVEYATFRCIDGCDVQVVDICDQEREIRLRHFPVVDENRCTSIEWDCIEGVPVAGGTQKIQTQRQVSYPSQRLYDIFADCYGRQAMALHRALAACEREINTIASLFHTHTTND